MISITGSGIISALGVGKDATLEALQSGRSGIGAMHHLPSCHRELPAGEVPLSNDEMKQMLQIDSAQEVSRTVLMGIVAAREAAREARITTISEGEKKVVLISGTTVGGMDLTERNFLYLSNKGEEESYTSRHDCGSSTQAVADSMGIFSNCITISTACSSAANALMLGARMLLSGEADVAVCGGSEALSLFHLNGFNSLMILDHKPCRPFDASRAGLNLGEGAAYVVLERSDDASKRGAQTLAYLTGWGNACDAFHQTATSPNGEGAFLSMKQALQTAHLLPDDVDYINAHGTGTVNNDASEGEALKRIFCITDDGNAVPPFSSTKGLTGHTTSAAGAIESVICLLAMQHRFIPASKGFSSSSPEEVHPSAGQTDVSLRNVMCNSFGFGGNDTTLIFSAEPSEPNLAFGPMPNVEQYEEIVQGGAEAIKEIGLFIKPLEARRMSRVMKASLLTSLKVLKRAGLACPDAIITATAYGCTGNSEKILHQLSAVGEEQTTSPTLFMQSTHNTIGSAIAIRLGCHGYNSTYTQGDRSLECALNDAHLLLREGNVRSVLVGCHDEFTPLLRKLLGMQAAEVTADETVVRSRAILLVRKG